MTVEDTIAIHHLLATYNHLIDNGEGEAWADLFVDGGSLVAPPHTNVKGRDAMVSFGAGVPQVTPGVRHVISNIDVDVAGDTATGRCYLHLWIPGEGGPKVMLSGRYRDTFRKVDGTWRFVDRFMTSD